MDSQARINALISYFFLGWLMLLSKNPEWNDSFVRMHAKNATKIHLVAILIFVIYTVTLKELTVFPLPFFGFSFHTFLITLFFLGFLGILIYDAYGAYHGKKVGETFSLSEKNTSLQYSDITALSELEKMILIGSFFPFLGVVITYRYPNSYTEKGLLVGGFFTFLIVFSMIANGAGSNAPLILSFLFIAVIVAEGVWMFVQSRFLSFPFLDQIPSVEVSFSIFRAGIRYGIAFLPIIFGREKNLSFRTFLEAEIHHEKKNPEPLFAPAWLIGIPFLNLIFFPPLLSKKSGIWRQAIIQGLILDGILLFLWLSRGFSTSWALFTLFPIFRIFAMIPHDPEARIPVLYEIFYFFDSIFSHILTHRNTLKSKQDSVSFHYTEEKNKENTE